MIPVDLDPNPYVTLYFYTTAFFNIIITSIALLLISYKSTKAMGSYKYFMMYMQATMGVGATYFCLICQAQFVFPCPIIYSNSPPLHSWFGLSTISTYSFFCIIFGGTYCGVFCSLIYRQQQVSETNSWMKIGRKYFWAHILFTHFTYLVPATIMTAVSEMPREAGVKRIQDGGFKFNMTYLDNNQYNILDIAPTGAFMIYIYYLFYILLLGTVQMVTLFTLTFYAVYKMTLGGNVSEKTLKAQRAMNKVLFTQACILVFFLCTPCFIIVWSFIQDHIPYTALTVCSVFWGLYNIPCTIAMIFLTNSYRDGLVQFLSKFGIALRVFRTRVVAVNTSSASQLPSLYNNRI